jgi:pimeloyl-ACP methyl ester carboxylesterase
VSPLYVEARGSGRPVLLVHGLGASTYTWRHVAPGLSARYRVVAVDLKGFGRASKPRDRHYSVLDQARHLVELVGRLGLTDLTIVGHSLGGGVALAAVGSPSMAGRVRSLVLIDSMAYRQRFPWLLTLLRLPLLGPAGLQLLPKKTQVRLALRTAYHRPVRISETSVDVYAAPLRTASGRRALVETARSILPADADAFTEGYGSIDRPTLILWGRHDAIVPLSVGERLHHAIEGSRLVVIDDAGHLPHEETPAAVSAELDRFLG